MEFDRPDVRPADIPAIALLFGLTEPLEVEYLGGIPNATYRIASAGRTLAVRVCNNGYTSPEHLICELRTLRHLRRYGFDLAPEPVPGDDGELIQSWRGYRVVATAYIDGVAGDRIPLGVPECRQIGAAVARLGAALRGLDHGLSADESFRARSVRLLDGLAGHAPALGWPDEFAGVPGQFDRAMRALETAGPTGWYPAIHADIWPPNTLYRDGTLVGLIDFDDLSHGPPVLDIAAVVCEFAFPEADALDEPLARAALAGFRAAGGDLEPTADSPGASLTDAVEALCASWLAANALHQVPFAQSRSLAERLARLADPVSRAGFAQRLTGLWQAAAPRDADRSADTGRSPV